jgi:hypothetical protein
MGRRKSVGRKVGICAGPLAYGHPLPCMQLAWHDDHSRFSTQHGVLYSVDCKKAMLRLILQVKMTFTSSRVRDRYTIRFPVRNISPN